jgi:hypothetical protein
MSCKGDGVPMSLDHLFPDLETFIVGHGVEVRLKKMDIETPGEFDGLSITINPRHDLEARCFYLAHSFGSIVQWSTDYERAKKVVKDVRSDPQKGIAAYRNFEQTSSEHAVWVLNEIGHADAVAAYTTFFRADIESMTIFHLTGKAPDWPEFFAEWKRKAASGEIQIEPFTPRAIPPFHPVRIREQEVLQQR